MPKFDPSNIIITWGDTPITGYAAGLFAVPPPLTPKASASPGATSPGPPREVLRDEQSDLERAQAVERVAQIRAALERAAPGCTYGPDEPGRFHYRIGPGDRWARYVSICGSLGGNSPVRYEVCEGVWLPEAGPISDSAGPVPADEALDVTARRLRGLPVALQPAGTT